MYGPCYGLTREHSIRFGDVVVFDSTDRTNTYCMSFAPFTGVNYHYQSKLFGYALIRYETEESYI